MGSMTFWLLSLILTVTALLPDYTLKAVKAFNIRFGPIMPGTGNCRRDASNRRGNIEVTAL